MMSGTTTPRLRVLELEPVRAKRSRPSLLPLRRLGSPGSMSASAPIPPAHDSALLSLPPLVGRPLAQPSSSRSTELEARPWVSAPIPSSPLRPHPPAEERGGLPTPWPTQRPHRRRSKAHDPHYLDHLPQAQSGPLGIGATSTHTRPMVYSPAQPPMAPVGSPFHERAPRRAPEAGPQALPLTSEAGAGRTSSLVVSLDALRPWVAAGDVSDFGEDARKLLGNESLAVPLRTLGSHASLVLRLELSSAAGLEEGKRRVVAGLRFHLDLRALAYAAGVSSARLWTELLAWHEKHGQQLASESASAQAVGSRWHSGAARESRLRSSEHAAEKGHHPLRASNEPSSPEGGTTRERPMQRTQHGTRADSLVASELGVTSLVSPSVREKLAKIAAAAEGVRRTLRVKIEDEQDLLLAWKALLECSVFLSRLAAEAAIDKVTPVEKLAQIMG